MIHHADSLSIFLLFIFRIAIFQILNFTDWYNYDFEFGTSQLYKNSIKMKVLIVIGNNESRNNTVHTMPQILGGCLRRFMNGG